MRLSNFRPNRSIGRRIFNIFQDGGRPPFWILIFDQVTVIMVLICRCVQNFIKIGSRVRPPDAHNCWMFNAATAVSMATASWRTCRERDGMRAPNVCPNRSIRRRVIAFPTFCNMAAVRHLEFKFSYSGPPMKSAMRFNYPVKICCRSDIWDIAIL